MSSILGSTGAPLPYPHADRDRLPPQIARRLQESNRMTSRQTRSGRSYAYLTAVTDVDVAPLLRASLAADVDTQRDWEHGDEPDDTCDSGAQMSDDSESDRSPDSPTPPAVQHRKRKGKPSRQHRARKKKRAEGIIENGHVPRNKSSHKHTASASVIPTPLNASTLPATHGAYVAKNGGSASAKRAYTPDDLDRLGFKRVPWDGAKTVLVHDASGRVVAVLVAKPDDPSYNKCTGRASAAVHAEGQRAMASGLFSRDERQHRRGRFPAVNVGVTAGMGPPKPVNLDRGVHGPMLGRLLGNPDIQRMASCASAAFQCYAPRVYAYYREHLDPLFHTHKYLDRIFERSVYPCAAFNFGPHVCSFKHRNPLNCPFGYCAIQALGEFDHTKGGHIILWDLKLYIEFPSGSLVLILSASLVHSNTPTAPNECRASFTQFCGGGLFRYVDNKYRTEKTLQEEDPEGYEEMMQAKNGRWEMGLGLLSTVEEFVKCST